MHLHNMSTSVDESGKKEHTKKPPIKKGPVHAAVEEVNVLVTVSSTSDFREDKR